MGGNALRRYGTCLLLAEDAKIMGEGIVRLLPRVFSEPEMRATMVPSHRCKRDFDNIDILVSAELPARHSPDEIASKLAGQLGHPSPLVWLNNGPELSLGIPVSLDAVFQVSLIAADPQWYDFALGYYSWDDLGGLMGRIAHHLGLNLSRDGLWLPLRDGSHLYDIVLVTRDFDRAIEFLGFDSIRFRHGFDTPEEIFAFVAAGKRFTPELFPREHRRHRARTRSERVPTYTKFLDWLSRWKSIQGRIGSPTSKTVCVRELFEAFPEAEPAWATAQHDRSFQKAFQRRFNSDLLARITGLKDRDLASLVTSLRSGFSSTQAFQEHILSASDSELTALIATHYTQLQGTRQEID